MDRSRFKRIQHFAYVLLMLAVPAIFIVSASSLPARANVSTSAKTSLNPSQASASGLPVVDFEFSSYAVSENVVTRSINVLINPAPDTTATVEYLAVNGTATSADYTVVPGTLTFTSSDTTESFIITIHEDSIDEPDETVNLILRNPVNAELSGTGTVVLTIQDNDPTPTNTPGTQNTPTPVYVDVYEPNNTLQNSYPIQADAGAYCNITLWPIGDLDFFRFAAKAGLTYSVTTSELSAGLDTEMAVFNTQGNHIASNDDYEFGNRASQVIFSASVDGFYYARITNKSAADPANKKYCIEVEEVQGTPTATPIPTGTRVPGADACEYNGDFGSACLIGPGETYNMNFVPLIGEGPDNDYYRMWIKAGIFYSCETLALSSVNDTNMIIYDQNGTGLAGNDDKAPGDRGSKVTYLSTYTGWLYILVGPYAVPEYGLSYLYTYSLLCEEDVPTPTITPTSTATPRPPTTGGGGGTGGSIPTITPFVVPTFPPFPDTPTPFMLPTATNTPVVQVNPLPTETPPGGQTTQNININLTVYYDANNNFTPELTEGVEDVTVAIYDNNTNELLAVGYTNEAGLIQFPPLLVTGPVRISIPYLQFNQITVGDSNIFIRIAPWPSLSGGAT